MRTPGVNLDSLDTIIARINKPGGLGRYEGLKRDPHYVECHRFFASELAAKPKAEALMLLNLAAKRLFEISMKSEIRTPAQALVDETDALLMDQEGYPRQVIRAQDKKVTELAERFFGLAVQGLEKNNFANDSKKAQARLLFDIAAALGVDNFKPGIAGNEKIAALINKKAKELSQDTSFNDILLGQLVKLANHDFGISEKVEAKVSEAPGPYIHPGLNQNAVENFNLKFTELYTLIDNARSNSMGSREGVELGRFYSESLLPLKKQFLDLISSGKSIMEPEGLTVDQAEAVQRKTDSETDTKIEEVKRNLTSALALALTLFKELDPTLVERVKKEILNPLSFNMGLIAFRDESRSQRFLAANLVEQYISSLKQIKSKDPQVEKITNTFKRELNSESAALYKQEESPSEEQKIRITKLLGDVESFRDETVRDSSFLDQFTEN